MVWEWADAAFAALPGYDENLFQRLLLEKRFKFNDQELPFDDVDKYSARLVCAALHKHRSLFLGLPDNRTYRPAFLCALAILQTWLNAHKSRLPSQKVLYFGSTVRVREHLRHITVGDVNLAEAFSQQDVGKKKFTPRSGGKRSAASLIPTSLPQVVTIYAPIDPEQVVKTYKPAWIAIDCDDALHLSWLEPLLKYAAKEHITVIGWGNNHLSECIAQFTNYSAIFCWPTQISGAITAVVDSGRELAPCLEPTTYPQIRPVIMQSTEVDTLESALRSAKQSLIQAFQMPIGRLGNDAVRLHWRYLRSLEALTVPFEFYEAEVNKYWGLQSFSHLQEACRFFREACREYSRDLTSYLEQASSFLDTAQNHLKSTGNPFWHALANICIEEPPVGKARFVTFTSRMRKQLFLLALLARLNITESDLRTLNVWVTSLDELRYLLGRQNDAFAKREENPFHLEQSLSLYPLLAGLPSPSLTPKLMPMLLHKVVDILIYPYQNPALLRYISEWAVAFKPDLTSIMHVLSDLSDIRELSVLPHKRNVSLLHEEVIIEVKSGQKKVQPPKELLWQPLDPLLEIARLLEADEEKEDENILAGSDVMHPNNVPIVEEMWCGNGIEIDFDQGWRALFAPDEFMNVVVSTASGLQVDYRSVNSLQVSNRVIAIPGQRRQSVYELLISRVHKHPSIELHLALIRRWQEDFASAYQRWHQPGRQGVEELLRLLQKRGSKIVSTATINLWLRGYTLCPDDVEDLRRLTEVFTMEFVHQYYRRIYVAAQSLRVLHRNLSKQLNRWLKQEAAGLAVNDHNQMIDAELGLTFEDFRNSLLLLQVEAIRIVPGPFLRSRMGNLERVINNE